MNYNELAKFEYKGKTYVYYTLPEKPKNLLYGYLENNELKPVIDPDEAFIMQEAYKKAFISDDQANYVKLNIIKYNGKLFQKMYDKISKLTFFYEIKDNKFYMPNDEDLLVLSSLYNKDEFNFGRGASDKKGTIKKIIKIAGLSLSMIINVIMVLKALTPSNTNVDRPVYERLLEKETEFSSEKLAEALQSNPNLTNNEKTFLKDCLVVLDENSQYVEMNEELQRLETLIIKYNQDAGQGVAGGYAPWDISITLPRIISFNDMSFEQKEILVHEFFHCLSHPDYGIAGGLFEAVTGVLTSEFLGTRCGDYYEVSQLKILSEIIGPKPILAAYFSGDINYIIKPLKKLIPNEDLAYQLINGINDVYSFSTSLVCGWAELPEDEVRANIAASRITTNNIMDQYFTAAKGYSMYSDLLCLLYLKAGGDEVGDICLQVDPNVMSCAKATDLMPKKGYFIGAYVKKHPKASLEVYCYTDYISELFDDGTVLQIPQTVNIPIDDNNRKLPPPTFGYNIIAVPSESIADTKIIFGSGLQKGLTEVISEEENYKEARKFNNYKEQATYVKILCELIGVEPFERYLANGDINEIIDALCNIIPDRQAALALIGRIDITMAYYEGLVDTSKPAESKKAEMVGEIDENLTTIRGEIYTSFFIYFDKKDPENKINGNVIVNTYYRQLTSEFSFECSGHIWPVEFVTSDGEFIAPDSYESVNVVKAYFDPSFKEAISQPYLEVKFEGDTLNSRFAIDENGEPVTKPTTEIIFIDENNIDMARISGDNNSSAYCQYIEARDKTLS
jgi:hypothetical protein